MILSVEKGDVLGWTMSYLWCCIQADKRVIRMWTFRSWRLRFWPCCCDHIDEFSAWVVAYHWNLVHDLVYSFPRTKEMRIGNKKKLRGMHQNTVRCIRLVCITKGGKTTYANLRFFKLINLRYCIHLSKRVISLWTCRSLRLCFWYCGCDHFWTVCTSRCLLSNWGGRSSVFKYTYKSKVYCSQKTVRGNQQKTVWCIQLVCIIKGGKLAIIAGCFLLPY